MPLRFKENQKSSRLFRLPPELRNRIYDLVLADIATTRVIDLSKRADAPRREHTAPYGHRLLYICRQIRSEAAGLYYSRTVFDFRKLTDWDACLDTIPEIGEAEYRLIQHIKIHWFTLYGPMRSPESLGEALTPHPFSASLRSVDVAMPGSWYQNDCKTMDDERKQHTRTLQRYFCAPALDVRFSGKRVDRHSLWNSSASSAKVR
ncbi:hypothetical protein NX059_008890 [Plenodomus lindquistii]|nr:hypothetical protein NX059_008890 [Plenodomus lindquistii]